MVITKKENGSDFAPWVGGNPVYVVESSYNERHMPKQAGFSWNGYKYRCWWTSEIKVASKLATYADNSCREELLAIKNKRERSLELSRKAALDANFPCPDGLSYMPFQNGGIAYAIERKNTFLTDAMGLGKTIQSIGFINVTRPKKVLIVCPNSIKINWSRELSRWLVEEMKIEIGSSTHLPNMDFVDIAILNYETARKFCFKPTTRDINASKEMDKKKLKKLKEDCFVTKERIAKSNYDAMLIRFGHKKIDNFDLLLEEQEQKICNFEKSLETKNYDNPDYNEEFATRKWDLLIVDECHYIKSSRAIRSKSVYRLNSKRKLFLTGTPIVNRPSELWPFISHLDPESWKDKYYYYHKRYCGGTTKGVTMENLPELQTKLRESIMIRRLKQDVLTELPAKRRQVIEVEAVELVELLKEEREIYERSEEKIKELQSKLELSKVMDDEKEYRSLITQLKDVVMAQFQDLARIRVETAEKKIPYIIKHLEEVLEQEDKVIFFCHHKVMVDAVMKHFGKIAVKIDGRVTKIEDRQESVDRFQDMNSGVKLFVGSIMAAGVGLTLTASSTVVFGELDWVPGNMQQAEDRAHRIGQKDCVLVQLIVLSESVDVKMAHTIIQKIEIIEAALDNEETPNPETEILDPGDHVRVDKKKVEKYAPYVSMFARNKIHEGLQILSSVCDGARQDDMAGFNIVDTRIGKSLAYQSEISNKQALLGLKLLLKYHRQLPKNIVEVCRGEAQRIKIARETVG